MSLFAQNAPLARRIRQVGSALGAVALLLSFGVLPHAYAQTIDTTKPDQKPADTVPMPSPTPNTIGEDVIDPTQPLKPGFIVNVSVVGEPDPSGNYVVDPAGNISIRYQGIQTPIAVRGQTPGQAADSIAKFLKTYIKNPQVSVTILQVPRPTVFVSGAVRAPGPYTVTGETTLVDLLSRAVWTENADLSQVRITRRLKVQGPNGEEIKPQMMIVQFDKYIRVDPGSVPDEKQNPVLQDKDSVFVPFKLLPGNGVVSVFGEVTKPQQAIPLRINPPMTVREVINLVGGTTPGANRKAISIRRATVDRPLVIDLDKAEQGDLVNNIELKPDDAIYVEKLENNAYVNINGGFVKTGKFIYDKRTTLTQAIEDSGGVAPFAKVKDGKIFRHPDNDPKNTRIIAFNWDDIQKGKAPDIELQPGDSVWIAPGGPSQKVDFFTVMGGLTSAVFLYNNLTGRWFR
ncbi:MAG TPA: SLBB domain-containing protein [Chthonomonadaceae bacterium]|nr:SLBB domain-containing protein [Chthonomonadaceae bacterium]